MFSISQLLIPMVMPVVMILIKKSVNKGGSIGCPMLWTYQLLNLQSTQMTVQTVMMAPTKEERNAEIEVVTIGYPMLWTYQLLPTQM